MASLLTMPQANSSARTPCPFYHAVTPQSRALPKDKENQQDGQCYFGYYIYRGFQKAGDCRDEQKWGNISGALRREIQIELTLRGNMLYTEGVLYPELDNFFC